MAKRTGQQPRADLSRERIVNEALALIDESGLPALSMRSLANRLGVYPTALYWYVDTRSSLLAAVVELVLGNVLPQEDGPDVPWQDWTMALMRSYRAAIMRHPNVAPLLGADLTSNPGVDMTVVESLLAHLEAAGFHDDDLLHAYNSIMAGMIGFVTLELAAAPTDDERWAETLKERYRAADIERFPTIRRWAALIENRAFVVRWHNGATAPMDDAFEHFASALLHGLEAGLHAGAKR